MTTRFMYLRNSYGKNKKGPPIGCIAIEKAGTTMTSAFTYAVSMLNPKDVFNRSTARNIAVTRLHMTDKRRMMNNIFAVYPNDNTRNAITRAVMTDIAKNMVLKEPARNAALAWLNNKTYEDMAKLVASKLSKEELIEFAEMLDKDANDDFFHHIQCETSKIAPEIFA